MDDAKRNLLPTLSRFHPLTRHRRLESDNGTEVTLVHEYVVHPHISLKARMLGGQAETIRRLGGLPR
jgi:hypothetical protein